jgi:glycine betaine/proline transport system permease protein
VTAIPVGLRAGLSLGLSTPARLGLLLAVVATLFVVFRGTWTLPHHDDAGLFRTLNGARDWVDANRTINPVFLYVFGPLRAGIDALSAALTFAFGKLSWVGFVAIASALGLALVSWRTAILVAGCLTVIGLFGLWTEMVQTLVLISAAVTLSLAIGIPLGVLAGRNDRFQRFISPVLDFMQIMPAFAYLAPLTLIFLIGPSSAVIATLIYSIPPAVRITALGIRGVPSETVEAATSLGSSGRQILRKVQLPMARRTIGLAVNQTIMMALSIIVIAALINAPGLGETILVAIEKLKVGAAVEAGLAIVLLATVLDRVTAGASTAPDVGRRIRRPAPTARRRVRFVAAGTAVAGVVAGLALGIGTAFPKNWHFSIAKPVDDATRWIEINLNPATEAVKNFVSAFLLDPLQGALTESPFWLVIAAVGGIAFIVSGRRAAISVVIALLGIVILQVWEHAMQTLTMVLVGVALTMIIGIALGVSAARSRLVSTILRPINDAAQTLPAFVYLVPAVALFGPTRFTAIVAAVIYAAPAVIRLVEDGVRGVSSTVVEAATASGASRLQMILKVQLPMARRSLLVAVNQGVVLVLAVVVIGGLVGGGALGFDVVAGFSQFNFFGRGMAAAIGIVLLGVVLDRITQGAAGRRRIVGGVARRLVLGAITNRPTAEA